MFDIQARVFWVHLLYIPFWPEFGDIHAQVDLN
jgi:hypothetical protein